ncbi:hypothetical protein GCM10010272_70220 [Streptomyces lateritius]|nr:hypothetical protein GCM10010272_70220 [Streptomyces lateritius]
MGAVDRCPGEVQHVRSAELGQEDLEEPGPDAYLKHDRPGAREAPAYQATPERETLDRPAA